MGGRLRFLIFRTASRQARRATATSTAVRRHLASPSSRPAMRRLYAGKRLGPPGQVRLVSDVPMTGRGMAVRMQPSLSHERIDFRHEAGGLVDLDVMIAG